MGAIFGYWPLILIGLLVLAFVRNEHKIEERAKTEGFRQAEQQIAEGIQLNEQDAAQELQTIMRNRGVRAAENVKTQSARKASDAKHRSTDQQYGSWASASVPQSVVDELRAGAEAANGVRGGTGHKQPVVAVRAESPAATGQDGQRPARTLRLGPSSGNR